MRNDAEIDLKAFTAKPAGIDRDAILFAAGRASARGAQKWNAAASLLAATQAGTLALFLWPAGVAERPPQSNPAMAVRVAEEATPVPVPEPYSLLVLSRSGVTDAASPKFDTGTVEPALTPLTRPETIQ